MNGRRIRTVYLMDGFGQRTIKNVDEAFIMNLHHEGWRMDRWERVRPWRPGRKRGCIWCSKSVNICVEVWLFMATLHWRVISVKNFFRDLGMSRNGSKNRVCAPKNRPIWFFSWSHRILQQKNSRKKQKSWAIVSFKKWAFMILLTVALLFAS